MVSINITHIFVAIVAAMGVPSALFAFALGRFERRLNAREQEQDERQAAQAKSMELLVQSSGAAISLAEATARAVQRIPDAHCNGDMHAALEYAATVKHRQKDFLAAQGIHAVWECHD